MFLTKKRLLRSGLFLVLAAVLIFALLPLLVSNGLRFWILWKARQQNLTCQIERIDAPLLRPVVLRGFHLSSAPDSVFRIDVHAVRAVVELNLRSIILRTRDRAIRTLSIADLKAEVHRARPGTAISESGWKTLQKMLPENLVIDQCNLRTEDGPTIVLLRDVSLRAGQIEPGPFRAGEVRIDSPLFRQSFHSLQGSTRWQSDHLTIAGLRLAPGFDLESITADLSLLSQQRIGLEFDVDTFGGKLRANVASEWHSQNTNWNVTAAATDISLDQTSRSLGFTDHLDGIMHACKFTFRGDPRDPAHATASLWTELTKLSWRNRAADVIMLGAALYNRQIQLQQLYVKQRNNQLNLNGEVALPNKAADWLNADFHGNISASIANLGDFASLFGANPGDFAGQVVIEGIMNTGGRKIGGHLTATGKSLSIFKSPVDTFAAKINLKANDLEIEQVDIQRQTDLLHGQGKIDLGPDHNYSGTGNFVVSNIAQYLKLLPSFWNNMMTAGTVTCDWSGNGNANGHSGRFRLNGRGLQTSQPIKLTPFNAELEGDYAPGNLFFRQAHFANDHLSLNGFCTVATKYLQLQAIALDLNGKPALRGNAFLPIALSKYLTGTPFLETLDQQQKMDADLAIEPVELTEISNTFGGQYKFSGNLAARISVFGNLDRLQGWSEIHLRDFVWGEDPAKTTVDGDVRLNSGTMSTNADVKFAASDAVKVESNLAVRLGEQHAKAATEPFSATFFFPKVSLAEMPHWLTRDWLRDGIFAGRLVFSETLQHPKISGDVQLSNGVPGNLPFRINNIAGQVEFKGTDATINSLTLASKNFEIPMRGEMAIGDGASIKMKLTGIRSLFDLTPAEADSCVQEVTIAPHPSTQSDGVAVDEIEVTGKLGQHDWAIALHRPVDPSSGSPDAARVFKFCSVGDAQKTLALGGEPAAKVVAQKPRKKSRNR